MKTIEIQSVDVVDIRIRAIIAVKDGNRELFGREIFARTQEEMNNTLANILAERTNAEAEAEKIAVGVWTPPVRPTEPETVPPTPKELQQAKVDEAEATYNRSLEELKTALANNQAVPNLISDHTIGLMRHAVTTNFQILNTERQALANLG